MISQRRSLEVRARSVERSNPGFAQTVLWIALGVSALASLHGCGGASGSRGASGGSTSSGSDNAGNGTSNTDGTNAVDNSGGDRPAGSFRVRSEPLSSGMEWRFEAYDVVMADAQMPTVEWELGDGALLVGMEITHVFGAAGVFEIMARSRDADGRVLFIYRQLVETYGDAPPTGGTLSVAVVAAPLSGPAPLTVSFSASAAGADSATFNWDFANGRLASGANVTQTFADPGGYSVRVFANSADGSHGTGTILVAVSAGAAGGGGGAGGGGDDDLAGGEEPTIPPASTPGSPELPSAPAVSNANSNSSSSGGSGGGSGAGSANANLNSASSTGGNSNSGAGNTNANSSQNQNANSSGGANGNANAPANANQPIAIAPPPWPSSDQRLNSFDGFTFGNMAMVNNQTIDVLMPPLTLSISVQVPYYDPDDFLATVEFHEALRPDAFWGVALAGCCTTQTPGRYPDDSAPWNLIASLNGILPTQYPTTPGMHYMNLFDPAVREAAAQYYYEQAVLHDAPGIFLDGLTFDPATQGQPPGTNNVQWELACRDLIKRTRDKLHTVGKRLIANGSGSPWHWPAGVVEAGDGFSIEMPLLNTWQLDYPSQSQVIMELNKYREILDADKMFTLRTVNLDWYPSIAAAVMMIRQPGDAAFLNIGYQYWVDENPGWLGWPQQAGPALGPYTVSNNVFTRAFQNGTITVNFYTRQVTVTGAILPP